MVFKQKQDDGSYIQMKVSEDATWTQATDAFVSFLHGCGYVFDSIEVGEHIVEQWSFQKRQSTPDEWVDKPKKKGKRHVKKK